MTTEIEPNKKSGEWGIWKFLRSVLAKASALPDLPHTSAAFVLYESPEERIARIRDEAKFRYVMRGYF